MNWNNTNKVIRIYCKNNFEWVEVQKFLFKKGYSWGVFGSNNNSQKILDEDQPFERYIYCNYKYSYQSSIGYHYTKNLLYNHAKDIKDEDEETVDIFLNASTILREQKLKKLNKI